jgi:type IV secretion system protein VirB2
MIGSKHNKDKRLGEVVNSRMKAIVRQIITFSLVFWVSIPLAMATDTGQGADLPWVGPLQKILDSLSGPVAKILGVIVIIIAGLGIAFGEAGSGMRKIFQIVFGLSIAFTATSLVTTLFGVTGGSVF